MPPVIAQISCGSYIPPTWTKLSVFTIAKRDVLDGFIATANGRVQDAIQKYEDALAKNPMDYNATHLLARLNYDIAKRFTDARRLAKATRAYEKSIKAIDSFIAGERVLCYPTTSL